MNRKNLTCLGFVLLMILILVFAEEEKYSSKYDNVDVDTILANPRLRNQYLNCYLNTAPCITADAKFFKEKFPEAFVTKCRACTPKQVEFFNKITIWYTENDPSTWKRIVEKTVQDIQKKVPT